MARTPPPAPSSTAAARGREVTGLPRQTGLRWAAQHPAELVCVHQGLYCGAKISQGKLWDIPSSTALSWGPHPAGLPLTFSIRFMSQA